MPLCSNLSERQKTSCALKNPCKSAKSWENFWAIHTHLLNIFIKQGTHGHRSPVLRRLRKSWEHFWAMTTEWIGTVVLERKIFKFRQIYFRYFLIYPLEKGVTPFVWNWLSSSGEVDENVKSLRTDGRQTVRKAHWSTHLRWFEK